MKDLLRLLPLCALAICANQLAHAQGCSDAGVCTAGPIGELQLLGDSSATNDPRHFARLTFSYAVGEQSTTIAQVVPEFSFGITDRLAVQVKVPYISASGNLGSNSGVGDPTITSAYAFIKRKDQRLDGLIGMKFPSGNANAQADDRSLPMPYQTSLGTTDLLLGINYRWKRWSGALAYQHVLDQGNANGFLRNVWADTEKAQGYFESYLLERANDAVGRIQYAFKFKKLAVQPGLLAIVHLGEDVQGNSAEPPQRVSIDGSSGLTLNLTVDARYALNRHWSVELAYGSPLVVREVRPDGLTRSLVANLGIAYRFGE